MRNIFQILAIFLCWTTLLISFSNVIADEKANSPDPNDRFICTKISTFVDGLEYDKTLKCETKDAICYIMEGFSMSCVPKFIEPQLDNTGR
jgi:hypothetical protein